MKLLHTTFVETTKGILDTITDELYPYDESLYVEYLSLNRWDMDKHCTKDFDKRNRAYPAENVRFTGTRIA